jgi:hypothetical protein
MVAAAGKVENVRSLLKKIYIVADTRLEPRFGKVGENPTTRVRIRKSIVRMPSPPTR